MGKVPFKKLAEEEVSKIRLRKDQKSREKLGEDWSTV